MNKHVKIIAVALGSVALARIGINAATTEPIKPPTPPESTFIWPNRPQALAWAEQHDLCVYAVSDGFATSRCGVLRLPADEADARRLSDHNNFGQYSDCLEWVPAERVLQSCEGERP